MLTLGVIILIVFLIAYEPFAEAFLLGVFLLGIVMTGAILLN